jgi:hypothetical protein
MSATRFDQAMPELRQQFLKEFGDGDWHELENIEILFGGSSPLDPENLLQAMERGGVKIERGNVIIDLGAPHSVSGEWCEDLVPTAGFRVIREENELAEAAAQGGRGELGDEATASVIAEVDAAGRVPAAPEPGTLDSINFPELPAQGPGPQFELTSEGVIGFAPASALDREGNNIQRLGRLHPPAPSSCVPIGRIAGGRECAPCDPCLKG